MEPHASRRVTAAVLSHAGWGTMCCTRWAHPRSLLDDLEGLNRADVFLICAIYSSCCRVGAARSACRTICMPHDLHAARSACRTICMSYTLHAARSACLTICMPYDLHALRSACRMLCMPYTLHAARCACRTIRTVLPHVIWVGSVLRCRSCTTPHDGTLGSS